MIHKIAITVNEKWLCDIDRMIEEGRYPNRSGAIQTALALLTERANRARLRRELAKLNPAEEQSWADQGLADASWPGY